MRLVAIAAAANGCHLLRRISKIPSRLIDYSDTVALELNALIVMEGKKSIGSASDGRQRVCFLAGISETPVDLYSSGFSAFESSFRFGYIVTI